MHTAPLIWATLLSNVLASTNCPCGWRVGDTPQVYTHRIFDYFHDYPDIEDVVHDQRAAIFNRNWLLYNFWQNSDNPKIRLNMQFNASNVAIKDGHLRLTQQPYGRANRKAFDPVSVAGLQTRQTGILYGTFRTVMKVEGATGRSCASFFWYRDDKTEIDIEAVTKGTSLVNNTINYTSHPSLDKSGNPIENATLSIPMSGVRKTDVGVFREHRFDWSPRWGVKYYLDGHKMHFDNHNVPRHAGNLQLKLWADGNKWWSGEPSSTEVTLYAKYIIAYFNTTSSNNGYDKVYLDTCNKAGGPSNKTICDANQEIDDIGTKNSVQQGSGATMSTTVTSLPTGGDTGPAVSSPTKSNSAFRLVVPMLFGYVARLF